MANPHPSTTRWLAAIFQQLSVAADQWRLLADSKAVEVDQCKRVSENLQAQLDEAVARQRALQEMVETQKRVIVALEQELPQASQHLAVSDSAQIPAPQTLPPPGTTAGLPSPSQPHASISLPQAVLRESLDAACSHAREDLDQERLPKRRRDEDHVSVATRAVNDDLD